MKNFYNEQLQARLMKDLGQENPMAVPRLVKIVLNMGVGQATQDIKELDKAVEELQAITGQQPSIRRARKSIAAFRLRAGMPIGAKVPLRRDRGRPGRETFRS